ncbi:MAG: TlpA disulfide reductase family protein [Pseudomonadota bacterium]
MSREDRARELPRRRFVALLYGAVSMAAIAPVSAPVARADDKVDAAPVGLTAGQLAELQEAASEALPKLVLHDEPRPAPQSTFLDGEGAEIGIAAFQGEVVVLNMWATWCPPCIHEMPSLDNLAEAMDGTGVRVVCVSADRAVERVTRFYADTRNDAHPTIDHLGVYIDSSRRFMLEAVAPGLPVTLIIDRQGREIARLVGDAAWDTPEVIALMKRIAQLTAANKREAQAAVAKAPS